MLGEGEIGRVGIGKVGEHADQLELARTRDADVFGVVGRDGGYTAAVATQCVVIPPLADARITPHTEGLCAVVWHLLVSHPALQQTATKWESLDD